MAIATETFTDADAASRRGAELIAAAGQEAVEARGRFSLALSGGKTPWRMIALLGDLPEMPWEQTQVFQVDERVAPPGDQDRNLTHLVAMLSISHQPAVRPMPVTSSFPSLSCASEKPVNAPRLASGLGTGNSTVGVP